MASVGGQWESIFELINFACVLLMKFGWVHRKILDLSVIGENFFFPFF